MIPIPNSHPLVKVSEYRSRFQELEQSFEYLISGKFYFSEVLGVFEQLAQFTFEVSNLSKDEVISEVVSDYTYIINKYDAIGRLESSLKIPTWLKWGVGLFANVVMTKIIIPSIVNVVYSRIRV